MSSVVISSSCLREGTNHISVLLLTDGQEQVDPVQFDLSIRDLGSCISYLHPLAF